jgi:predicted nucleic acid-binding protein
VALYALDTTTFSQLMREHPKVIERLSSLSADDRIVICAVVRGEILYGLQRLRDGKRRRALEEKAGRLFESIPCEAVPPEAAAHYAHVKRQVEKQGSPLDENDLWIAARRTARSARASTSPRPSRSRIAAPGSSSACRTGRT